VGAGGSADVGWFKYGEQSTFSLNYDISYTDRIRYSSWSALNQTLTMSVSRTLAPRWEWRFSTAADLSSRDRFLFSPTLYSTVASTRASFDDLASATLADRYTNNSQLASALTGAPLADSPARELLYGERMFSAAARTSLSYSYSPRLSIHLHASGHRIQHVSESVGRSTYLVPETTSANAEVGFSYSISPLTQLGASVITDRIVSDREDVFTTTSLFSWGRTFDRRWLVELRGGAAAVTPVRRLSSPGPGGALPVGGVTLGYRTFTHSFLGSWDRTARDAYGLGATASSTASGSWRWSRPGNSWWLQSSLSWQDLTGSATASTSAWMTNAGVGRTIGSHTAVLTQYVYSHYSGRLGAAAYNISQSAVRLSVIWARNPESIR
jgi:hypothetical protein